MAEGSHREPADVAAPTGGPTGAVVKADYTVPAAEADAPDDAESPKPPPGRSKKRGPGDPVKLGEEIADLRAKHDTGGLKPAEKGRLIDLEAEVAEAETPS